MTKAVFLDRDGVINRKPSEGDYVTRLEDFHVLPGVVESIAQLNHAGFCVIVVTNQRCIAKGLMTVADLEKMHRQMSESLARAGAIINGIYYCPHEMEPTCSCRKPAPGMLLDAARSRGIELSASWMIGDSDIDVEAAETPDARRRDCRRQTRLPTSQEVVLTHRVPLTSSRHRYSMLFARFCSGRESPSAPSRQPRPHRTDLRAPRNCATDATSFQN